MPVVVDCRNQPILAAADIENRQSVHIIGTGEGCPQVVEVYKDFICHRAIPCLQRTLCIRVLRPKLNKGGLRYYVHDI